jgi:osmotically-inducible protein OsmY
MRIQLEADIPRRRGNVRRTTMGFAAGTAAGAGILYFLDTVSGRRRRKLAVDRTAGKVRHGWRRATRTARGVQAAAEGTAQRLAHLREEPKQLDDATLTRKVESELFRDPQIPKGDINVNVQRGVVQLRGAVPTRDMLEALVERTRAIQGVREVESLLHLPSEPAQMHQ